MKPLYYLLLLLAFLASTASQAQQAMSPVGMAPQPNKTTAPLKPHIDVKSFSINPTNPKLGQPATLTLVFELSNYHSPLRTPLAVPWSISRGQSTIITRTESFSENRTATVTATWDPLLGRQMLWAFVDANNTLGDPTPRNFIGGPLLVEVTRAQQVNAQWIGINPAQPREKEAVSLRFRVETVGAGTGQVPWRIYGDNRVIASGTQTGLAASSTFEIATTWNAVEGNHAFYAHVDPDNTSGTTPGGVRTVVVPLNVPHVAKPDLVITGVRFEPANPTESSMLAAKPVIKNQGDGDAIFRPDTWVGGCSVPGTQAGGGHVGLPGYTERLRPGESVTEHFNMNPHGLSAGTYTVHCEVDYRNMFEESNEANNTFDVQLSIAPGSFPDLAVTSMAFDPPNPTANSLFDLVVTVKNLGQARAWMGVDSGFNLSETHGYASYYSGGGTGSLDPGASWTYRMKPNSSGAQTGTRTWAVILNRNNCNLSERNCNNNTLSADLTVR